MSDFAGLQIALSSLYAQRKALQVTGQNIANVNTEGYSRQRVELTADSGPVTPARESRYPGPGMGVLTGDTTRLRDQFLELRGYQEHAVDAGLKESQSVVSRVELAFDEPSDDGLSKLISGFLAGSAGGLLSAVNDVIPRYRAGLAAVAQQLSDDVNAVHRTGYALDGSTNHDFFTAAPGGGIQVDPAIVADPSLVAASGAAGATRDGSVAQKIAELTGFGDSYHQLVVSLGVESQATNRRVDVQAAIVQHVDAARESAAGVNLDEEMTAMLQFQHAYDAAARFLTTVDQTLDTLINQTGLVGR